MKDAIVVHPMREEILALICTTDTVWIDRKSKLHQIEDMDIDYVAAVLKYLHLHGIKREEMPTALFTRYKERHDVLLKRIRNLDEE